MLLFLGCTKCSSVAKGAIESNLLHCSYEYGQPIQPRQMHLCTFRRRLLSFNAGKIVLVVLLFDDKIKAPRCLLRKFKIICDTHWKNCKIGQLDSGTT